MDGDKPVIFSDWLRRAFELARGGKFRTIDELENQLLNEGCPNHVLGLNVKQMLRRAIEKS